MVRRSTSLYAPVVLRHLLLGAPTSTRCTCSR
jgi:hypothetical protein